MATAACIVLAFLVIQPSTNVMQTQQIALVQNQDKQSLWFIDVSEQGLSIKASSQLVAQTNKDYELWMILKGQDAPISLGLLPKQGSKILFKDNRFNASDIALLAVSLEPIYGSIAAYFLLGEQITWMMVIGGSIVIFTNVWATRTNR